jgi:predicted metalloprotease with PDZ domain
MEQAPTVEPMELQGRWLGMRLVPGDSASAREIGAPAAAAGVLVVEVSKTVGSRVMQAGVAPGDVIVAIDGKKVQTLGELYTVTTRQNVAQPLSLDIVRQGQQMAVMVPAAMTPLMPQASGVQAASPTEAVAAGLFVCPNDGLQWTQAQVGPDLRCPRCGGPVVR